MQAVKLLAAASLAVVALAAAGCGGSSKSAVTTIATATNPTGTAPVTHGRYSYPPVLVNNFMRSCTRGGQAKKAYCACTLDKLSNTVSTQDFTRIGLSGGKVSPRVRRAIKQATIACADKL